MREVACVGVVRTMLVADIVALGGPGAPAVIVTAGVHGDEQAAPWALLSLARDGLLDRGFAYRLWPCTNPSGYVLGTRESADGIDLNRSFGRGGSSPEARAMIAANSDRRFVLNLDLHEDFEADGFYCYEPKVDDVPFGRAIVQAIDDAGLPVQDLRHGYELGYPPTARHLHARARSRHSRCGDRGHLRTQTSAQHFALAQRRGSALADLRIAALPTMEGPHRDPPHRRRHLPRTLARPGSD